VAVIFFFFVKHLRIFMLLRTTCSIAEIHLKRTHTLSCFPFFEIIFSFPSLHTRRRKKILIWFIWLTLKRQRPTCRNWIDSIIIVILDVFCIADLEMFWESSFENWVGKTIEILKCRWLECVCRPCRVSRVVYYIDAHAFLDYWLVRVCIPS
jgi:hypothetical protein